MKKRANLIHAFVALILSTTLLACGSKPLVEIEINSDDNMSFDKKELKVPAGSKVKLTLNHTGVMSEEAMGHNVVILKQGTNVKDFAVAAMGAKDNGYIPDRSAVIARTYMVGGGESNTVTFDAPAKGSYDFICSFPGHYGVMYGKFIVE